MIHTTERLALPCRANKLVRPMMRPSLTAKSAGAGPRSMARYNVGTALGVRVVALQCDLRLGAVAGTSFGG
jgi:hypothetical protein